MKLPILLTGISYINCQGGARVDTGLIFPDLEKKELCRVFASCLLAPNLAASDIFFAEFIHWNQPLVYGGRTHSPSAAQILSRFAVAIQDHR